MNKGLRQGDAIAPLLFGIVLEMATRRSKLETCHPGDRASSKFLQYNQLDVLISQIYFRNKILHVSDSSCVHHQEFFTLHTAMVYVIQLVSRIRTERV